MTSNVVSAAAELPAEFWAIAAVAVLVDIRPFPTFGTRLPLTSVFVSVCFTFAIALLWGPGLAIAVQTVAVLVAQWRLRMPPTWLVFTIVRLSTALLAAGAVAHLFGPAPMGMGAQVERLGVPAILAAAAAWFTVSYGILIVGLRRRLPLGWRRLFSRTFGYELLCESALLLLVPAFVNGPNQWAILLLLVPIGAIHQIARLSKEHGEQARHDSLTGLLSRRGLFAELEERTGSEAALPDTFGGRFGLLLVDLDRFKNINDALGHAVGDRLLAEVGRRLTATARRGDLVARLGGDEFVILAPAVADVVAARALAAEIAAALAEPAYVDGLPLDVSASVGVALCPDHGSDVATLLHHADVAMYEAKAKRGTVAIYSEQSDRTSPEQLSLLADLRLALEEPARRDEVSFHYQPQVDLATGEVVGLEALLRWQHPTRGLVNPADAVRVAEYSSVMHLLTLRAFDSVVSQLSTWNAQGLSLRASINVSVRDLHTAVLAEYLGVALRRSGISPGQIEVEVTETALMTDPETVLVNAGHLADLGVRLALDDFGTGYSSLQHLRRLPLSEVKIDRSFVQSMTTNSDDETIVRAVIELAHALGLHVVAEGVDNSTTHRMLAAAGCDIGQGWYYAKAMPADGLVSWLSARSSGRPDRDDGDVVAGSDG